MLDISMLAKDRRRETYLLAICSIFLVAQVCILFFISELSFEKNVFTSLFLGYLISACSIIWSVVRLLRLARHRSILFSFGLFLWLAALIITAVAQLYWQPIIIAGLQISWAATLLLLCMLLSCIVRITGVGIAHEIAWPLLKPIHWLYALPVLTLHGTGILGPMLVFPYISAGLFLIFRYAFNRWIYATKVVYPYKPTAAKFYIKQMRQS